MICICEVAQSLYFRSHSGRNGPGGVASFLSFSGLGKVSKSQSLRIGVEQYRPVANRPADFHHSHGRYW